MRALRHTVLAATGGALSFGFDGAAPVSAQPVIVSGDYAPKGMPLGAFRLFPMADLDFVVDDNVYRTEANEVSDEFFVFNSALSLQSQWSVHQLELSAGLADYQYTTLKDESHFDWNVGARGRLDIVRGSNITASATHRSTHELRTSVDQSALALEPTPYSLSHFDVAILHQPNRLGISAGASLDTYDYDATRLINGLILGNEDRNRSLSQFWGKVGYEFSPGYSSYLRTAFGSETYEQDSDRNGLDREATSYTIDAGLDLLVTNLITGQVFVGYLNWDYEEPLEDISGFNFGATVTWTPSALWALRFFASRTPNATIIANASAQDTLNFGAGFDYAFRPNIVVQGDIQYTKADFSGAGRDDSMTSGALGLRYLMNAYLSADARYQFSTRDSTAFGQTFDDNTITIGLRLQV